MNRPRSDETVADGGVDVAPNTWLVGTSSKRITPDESMWLSGWAARERPSQGVEQDLHAKAVALEDGCDNRAVLVSLELLFVPKALRSTVVDRCGEAYGLSPDEVVVNATHTHCGPVVRDERAQMYGLSDERKEQVRRYRSHVEDVVVDIVGEALESSAPARLSYGTGRCAVGTNRRLLTDDGIEHVPNLNGPVDTDVPVLVATREDAVEAIVFSYACHPTTMVKHPKFGGDWAGFAQSYLEETYSNATALFMTGCAGDQNPYPRGTVTLAEQHGRTVANAVEVAVEAQRKPVHGPLRTVYEEQPVAFDGPPSQNELRALLDSDHHRDTVRAESLLAEFDADGEIQLEYPFPVQGIGFGSNLTLLALAGEVTVEYGLELKNRLPGSVWVVGYSNEDFTYIPTERAIYEGGYEGGDVIQWTTYPGPLATDVEERVLTAAEVVGRRVSGP